MDAAATADTGMTFPLAARLIVLNEDAEQATKVLRHANVLAG